MANHLTYSTEPTPPGLSDVNDSQTSRQGRHRPCQAPDSSRLHAGYTSSALAGFPRFNRTPSVRTTRHAHSPLIVSRHSVVPQPQTYTRDEHVAHTRGLSATHPPNTSAHFTPSAASVCAVRSVDESDWPCGLCGRAGLSRTEIRREILLLGSQRPHSLCATAEAAGIRFRMRKVRYSNGSKRRFAKYCDL